ncbi:MAG: hypothetical protein M1396_00520 [Chloroflexi bacterium]|nr:hypothetical protein [Chloroflexota bacterium]
MSGPNAIASHWSDSDKDLRAPLPEDAMDEEDVLTLLQDLRQLLDGARKMPITGHLILDWTQLEEIVHSIQEVFHPQWQLARYAVAHQQQLEQETAKQVERILGEAQHGVDRALSREAVEQRVNQIRKELLAHEQRERDARTAEVNRQISEMYRQLHQRIEHMLHVLSDSARADGRGEEAMSELESDDGRSKPPRRNR